jgi:preprotein translocase subunit YajC
MTPPFDITSTFALDLHGPRVTLLGAGSFLGDLGGFLLPLVIFGIAWVLLIRPMSATEKERKARADAIKVGDKVVLTGGLLGRISRLDEKIAVVELADKVKVRVLRKDIVDTEDAAVGATAEGEKAADKTSQKDKAEG